jgi:hypothetical protein
MWCRSGRGLTEQDVNSLGSQHVDERELLLSKYESELTTLHQSQYREFREVPVLFFVSPVLPYS